jgi:hypothetical protein
VIRESEVEIQAANENESAADMEGGETGPTLRLDGGQSIVKNVEDGNWGNTLR